MIDLSKQGDGRLGHGVWFSSLMLGAIQIEFTGGVLVQTSMGDAAVFFREGQPVHASGQGFREHYLGQVLLARSVCAAQQVEAAVAEQKGAQGSRPLLGAILVRDGVDPNEVKRAIQAQTHARLGSLMQLDEGTWSAAPGESPRVREVGVPLDAWATFFELMQGRAASAELTYQADNLLGRGVKLKAGDMPNRAWTPEERKLLGYLEKPRKPDQLERAIGKRKLVRGFLRTLSLMDRIEVVSVNSAIPIPKAVKIQGAVPMPTSSSNGSTTTTASTVPEIGASDLGSSKGDVIRPRRRDRPHPLVAEIKKFHQEMTEKNHFQVLGVEEQFDTGDLRKKFTELAKKFHPDAWPTEIDKEGEVADKAREISARLNDAYEVLGNDDKCREYKTLLRDDRIKGDYRKLEKIRDAELRYKMGVVHLNKREYPRARDMFRMATENDPSSGLYQASLAWAMYGDPAADKTEVIDKVYDMLMEAVTKNENEPIIHYYLGQVLKAKDRPRDALHHFKRVTRECTRYTDAASEARYLHRRLNATPAPKSSGLGLSRFFGRKK